MIRVVPEVDEVDEGEMDDGLARATEPPARDGVSRLGAQAWWAVVTLCVGLGVTFWARGLANADAELSLSQKNHAIALEATGDLQQRFDGIERALRLAKGFIDASHHIDRTDWKRFVKAIELERQYPGVYGFAYVERVSNDRLPEYFEDLRNNGIKNPTVRLPTGAPETDPNDEMFLVKYHEPEDANRDVIGLNVAASPKNRIVYEDSRDLATVRATGPFTLHQGRDAGPGVVMAIPVYKSRHTPETIEQRRDLLMGWIAAPVGLRSILSTDMIDASSRFKISLSPGDRAEGEAPVVTVSPSNTDGAAMAPISHTQISIGGRRWDLIFAPSTRISTVPETERSQAILAVGTIVSTLLTGIVWSILRTKTKAERLAQSMTASLRRSAEKQEALAASAKASSRAKSEFLANMSHEIRTPMTAILGYAELLDERAYESKADQEQREWLGSIRRSGEHLLSIINDVLDLSKIEAGRLSTRRHEYRIDQAVNDVIDPMRARARLKNIQLRAELTTEVPATVVTDPARFRQILINLVGNAVKFTNEGEVVMGLSYDGASLIVEVRDTGIGIGRTSLPKLFEAFEQADSSMARSHEGTGLGLAISRRLARMMGGDISASSTLGKGSVFRLTLPCKAPEDAGMLASFGHPQDRPSGAESWLQQKVRGRVLLVEDGIDNQRLITHILRRAGLEIDLANHGQDALDAFRDRAPYDVIVMDMQMPVMDGYTAAQRLRDLGCTTPIVALTAHAMDGDREKCVDAGCDEYATKPIDRHVLLGIIARLLETDPRRSAA